MHFFLLRSTKVRNHNGFIFYPVVVSWRGAQLQWNVAVTVNLIELSSVMIAKHFTQNVMIKKYQILCLAFGRHTWNITHLNIFSHFHNCTDLIYCIFIFTFTDGNCGSIMSYTLLTLKKKSISFSFRRGISMHHVWWNIPNSPTLSAGKLSICPSKKGFQC